MPFDDPLTLTVIVVGIIVACSIIIFAVWRRGNKRKKSIKQDQLEPELRGYPFKVVKSGKSVV